MKKGCVLFVALLMPWAVAAVRQDKSKASVKWADVLQMAPEWYASDEAARIADNILLYQRDHGGWPKNLEMASALTDSQKAALARQKKAPDSTIDNGATFTQLAFLAKVYTARKTDRHSELYRDAFFLGLDYLFKAQYSNGGWPQFYPDLSGYHKRITFNDGAMIGVMRLLSDVAAKKNDYLFVDESRRVKAEKSVEKGIDAILKTQVVVDGTRTVWGAQHDEVTFAPAAARTFEPVSLTGGESVGIVRFLMGIKEPGNEIRQAIESAVKWFEKSKLNGIRWVETRNADGRMDRAVVKDPGAGPLWARFYEIDTTRPIFIGRDGIVKYDVAEIEAERRNGYQWYVTTPAKLINEDYPKWKKRLQTANSDTKK